MHQIDEAVKLYEESVVPVAKSKKGFKGTNLLINRKTGKGVAITFWESESDARANEKDGYYREQVSKFIPFLIAPVIHEGYEVSYKPE